MIKRMAAFGGLMALALGGLLAASAESAPAVHAVASQGPACPTQEQPKSLGYASATKNDLSFNRQFRHCFATIDGLQMHYVIGGTGPQTMVLLHGWPQSWFEYRGVMPTLLPGRTVIAVDLPGLGDSTGAPSSYDSATIATYVHRLLDRLGKHKDVQLVAHDLGVGVAYGLAAQYRQQISGLFAMEFPLVGKNFKFADFSNSSFHFNFNRQEPLAEQLVTGREKEFLGYIYPRASHSPGTIPAPEAVSEYVRTYSRPEVLHNGFELYRAWDQNGIDNTRLEQEPLTIPVRLLTEKGYLGMLLPPLRDAAPAASGTEINVGHFIPEEAPRQVVDEINAFYPAH